jgi:serine phosphatase RsbU (regulator of sigma subunit)
VVIKTLIQSRGDIDDRRVGARFGYEPKSPESARRRVSPHRLSVAVLVFGLVVTAILTAASRLAYLHNEERLTKLKSEETASALGIVPVGLDGILGWAVSGASQARRPAAAFERSIAASMAPAGPFVTAGLVQMSRGTPDALVTVGAKPLHGLGVAAVRPLLERAATSSSLVTTRVVGHGAQRLAYLVSSRGSSGTFVAYAAQTLPADRRLSVPPGSPFAGLNVAIYWGKNTSPAELVATNAGHLPLGGTSSRVSVPFGDNALTLVISPKTSLAGALVEAVAWGILGLGLLFTLAMAAMTERLVRRRELAEVLATENRHLYQEQRGVAETLQRSLLPQVLPKRDDVELAARYLPGTAGLAIGGDWYDVVEVGRRSGSPQLFLTVGDVTGRGLEAAALMSMLRNAIRAFAIDGAQPSAVFAKVNQLLEAGRERRFATVLCGLLDVDSGELTLASAGHLAPIAVRDRRREDIFVPVGPPLGVAGHAYDSVRLCLEHGTTLLAFTDGLIERRGQPLSVGREQLRQAVPAGVSLQSVLDNVIAALVPAGAPDDIAILGVKWS